MVLQSIPWRIWLHILKSCDTKHTLFLNECYTYGMQNDEDRKQHKHRHARGYHADGTSGAIYGIGAIGAIVYYIMHATSFWIGVLGIAKGLVWPAMIVYKVFELLRM